MRRSERDVGELVPQNRGHFEPFDSDTTPQVVFAFHAGREHATVIEHIRGLSRLMSNLEVSDVENGVVFSDGSAIVAERWSNEDGFKQADILVMGHSAFDIMQDTDSRIIHGLVSGFRYRFSMWSTGQNFVCHKQPIAP